MSSHASTSQLSLDDDTELVKALMRHNEPEPVDPDEAPPSNPSKPRKSKKTHQLKAVVYKVKDEATGETHQISSWRMADHAYKQDPPVFPTRARGLFTEAAGEGSYRIVARGYNKFFNTGEVSWTKWDHLAKHTKGPYYLTLKSNGCIIFIAALSPSTIVVTSKHAIGEVQGYDTSHSQMGERWVEQSLAKVDRSTKDLARHLWEHKLTAVAELCDDSFEEHVLGYTEKSTGLHLHGLNHNTARLLTYPPDDVAAFAREWGFIETPFITLDSVDEVKSFTDECAKDGKWNGEWVEGFVVRASNLHDRRGDGSDDRLHAFMWKVKFDEPYLMWRGWRELTKAMLRNKKSKKFESRSTAKGAKGAARSAKGASAGEELYGVNVEGFRRSETRIYARWVHGQIDEDDEPFAEYCNNRGIIAARDRFYEWLETDEGRAELEVQAKRGGKWDEPPKKLSQQKATGSSQATESLADTMSSLSMGSSNRATVDDLIDGVAKTTLDGPVKWLVVPIAIPGCGKTMIGLALTKLFGWGHTQSDDIPGKKSSAKTFVANVTKLVQNDKYSVVYADKNNHLTQHREAMVELCDKSKVADVRLAALVWDTGVMPEDELLHLCAERINGRGERHQSLRPDEKQQHVDVLHMFIRDLVAFNSPTSGRADGQFHVEIRVPIELEPRAMLDHVIAALYEHDIVDRLPSDEERDEAIEYALGYSPSLRKEMTPVHNAKRKKGTEPRYYGVSVDVDLALIVPKKNETCLLPGPIQRHPHLTLVHYLELPTRQAEWDAAAALAEAGREVDVTLGPIMVLVKGKVTSLEASYDPADVLEGVDGTKMHVTVANGNGVKAYEGKRAIGAYRAGGKTVKLAEEELEMILIDVGTHRVKGKIEGLH